MSFPQFAFNNVKRNARAYFAYFLSSAFMVMIFFTFAVFVYHPDIGQLPMGPLKRAVLQISEGVIFVFAIFFVLYSIGMFLKSRQREFGLLLLLGATSSQINRLVFMENMLIGAGSIVTGIAGGLLLSKLFLLCGTRLMEIRELPFYWPTAAIWLTAVSFSLLFAGISLFTLFFIHKKNVAELLQGSHRPKKEPRSSLFLTVVGMMLLTVGFLALYAGKLSPKLVLLAAATGIAATYFFYSQLSVLVIRLLKRSRKALWRGTNLLWVSELAYKMKDNARILFLVTVVTSIASMSASFVLAVDETNRKEYENNPFAIEYYSFGEQPAEQELAAINELLDGEGVSYQSVKVENLYRRTVHDAIPSVEIIAASRFNRLAAAMNLPEAAPDNGEAILISGPAQPSHGPAVPGDKITLDSGHTVSVTKVFEREALPFMSWASILIVNDSSYRTIQGNAKSSVLFVYHVPEWNNGAPSGTDSPEAVIGAKLKNRLQEYREPHGSSNSFSIRIWSYLNLKQATALFSFIGIFIAFLFSVSSASFLYFKLHTELAADSRMYHALSKIGLSASEMRISATLQIGLLFFMPIVISTVQTLIVMRPVLGTMYVYSVYKPVLVVSAAFLGAQTVYFSLVRSRYLHRLKRMMV